MKRVLGKRLMRSLAKMQPKRSGISEIHSGVQLIMASGCFGCDGGCYNSCANACAESCAGSCAGNCTNTCYGNSR